MNDSSDKSLVSILTVDIAITVILCAIYLSRKFPDWNILNCVLLGIGIGLFIFFLLNFKVTGIIVICLFSFLWTVMLHEFLAEVIMLILTTDALSMLMNISLYIIIFALVFALHYGMWGNVRIRPFKERSYRTHRKVKQDKISDVKPEQNIKMKQILIAQILQIKSENNVFCGWEAQIRACDSFNNNNQDLIETYNQYCQKLKTAREELEEVIKKMDLVSTLEGLDQLRGQLLNIYDQFRYANIIIMKMLGAAKAMKQPMYKTKFFSDCRDEDSVRRKYKELVKKYHPDNNKIPGAADLFNTMMEEYNRALQEYEHLRV